MRNGEWGTIGMTIDEFQVTNFQRRMILFGNFEIRSTKSETNPKFEGINDKNKSSFGRHCIYYFVSVIWIFVIRNCFGFRISIFGF